MKWVFYIFYCLVGVLMSSSTNTHDGYVIIRSMFLVGLFLMLQPAHWKKKEKKEPEDESENKE